MKNHIEPIARLIGAFQKLPGVGQKTAQRYALKVVNMSDAEVKEKTKSNIVLFVAILPKVTLATFAKHATAKLFAL